MTTPSDAPEGDATGGPLGRAHAENHRLKQQIQRLADAVDKEREHTARRVAMAEVELAKQVIQHLTDFGLDPKELVEELLKTYPGAR